MNKRRNYAWPSIGILGGLVHAGLVQQAHDHLGALWPGFKDCLKISGTLGGEYDEITLPSFLRQN
ncbi:hypothetical protein [Xanthomonas hydrangeae]|uniref:hypothetical protein n=1 Tax=Xanthomonas hydrangeae TaxID=2775159 RepID=UPI0019666814